MTSIQKYLSDHFPKREDFNPYIIQNSIVDGEGTIHLLIDNLWTQIELGDVEYANLFRDELIALLVGTGRAVTLGKRAAKDPGLQARGF